jgi:hypothetical protein
MSELDYAENRWKSFKIICHLHPLMYAIVQGEAMHRKYKRLKLGSGQAYALSGA